MNVKIGKYTVDFFWPEQMLAVETDFLTGAQIRNPALVVADLREVLRGRSEP